ncbi:MAG: glycosyltransferase family 39 protein [Pyrinomonadaceae bacterium]|nr:glycosyltransferase family 39 protein [Pyrinomonadaceae bacterium]
MSASLKNLSATARRRALLILSVLLLAFIVRGLTANFVRAHLSDPGWFQTGTYAIFDKQAQDILDGRASIFWIDDPSRTEAAVYPPGYPLWLAFIYGVSGVRSATVVQNVQWVLDALSVLLVIGTGVTAYGWRVGLWAGTLAALSPLLALYGATPMADAPTNWIVTGGVWMMLLAAKRDNALLALGAGLMIGASCWLRANALLLVIWWAMALLLFVQGRKASRARLSLMVTLGAVLLITPIVVRNAVAFRAFVPTGLGTGTNLWEGIGETERAAEFGAVFGDAALIEQERKEMGLATDAPLGLYWPNGVERDRARTRKALNVIASHPLWYASVMARRMWGMLKYAGKPMPYYGSAGINVTSRKSLPVAWQGGVLTVFVNALGMVQSVFRYLALVLMIVGVWLALRKSWRTTWLLLATILYYLIVGSSLHMEIRYGLPMQSLLLIFAAVAVCRLVEIVSDAVNKRWRARQTLT